MSLVRTAKDSCLFVNIQQSSSDCREKEEEEEEEEGEEDDDDDMYVCRPVTIDWTDDGRPRVGQVSKSIPSSVLRTNTERPTTRGRDAESSLTDDGIGCMDQHARTHKCPSTKRIFLSATQNERATVENQPHTHPDQENAHTAENA